MTKKHQEALAIFIEEMGECLHIIGKIQRHGIDSCHPVSKKGNRQLLEMEVSHVLFALELITRTGLVDFQAVRAQMEAKSVTILPYLHHLSPEDVGAPENRR